MKVPPAAIEVKDPKNPKVSKPAALRPKMEGEHNRVEKMRAIEIHQHSNWAAPIITLSKPKCSESISGDFRLPVNQRTSEGR